MSGIRAASLHRLVNLLIDSGAAYCFQDCEAFPGFAIYVPLLGELIHEDVDKVVGDLRRVTRPFMRCRPQENGPFVYFNEIIEPDRFEAAIIAILGNLDGYADVLYASGRKHKDIPAFPMLSLDEHDEGSTGECIRRACLVEVSYAANRVREFGRPLNADERRESYGRVMPEYEPLVREAEQLALRIVRLRAIQRERAHPVERQHKNDWLKRSGREGRPVLESYAFNGLAIATVVPPQAAN